MSRRTRNVAPLNYVNVNSVASLKSAAADSGVDVITIANGTYSCANATDESATSLFFGQNHIRTRPLIIRPATPGGVTFDGGGATCGMFIGKGAKFLDWSDGFQFANWIPTSSGVVVLARHDTGEAAPSYIALRKFTIQNTCLGSNSPGNFNDHGIYISSAVGSVNNVIIEDLTVVAPADTTRLLHSGIQVFGGTALGESGPRGLRIIRPTITAKDGMLLWHTTMSDVYISGARMTNCTVFGIRQQYANSGMQYVNCISTGSGSQGFYCPAAVPDNTAPTGTTFSSCSFA